MLKEKKIENKKEKKVVKHSPVQGSNLFAAFMLIILGTVFLLNNFGILPWSIWALLWRLWPLILVFWGLEMVFNQTVLGRILLAIFGFLTVLGILYLILNYRGSKQSFSWPNEVGRWFERQNFERQLKDWEEKW